jgi:hypothetical protein
MHDGWDRAQGFCGEGKTFQIWRPGYSPVVVEAVTRSNRLRVDVLRTYRRTSISGAMFTIE